MDRMSQNEQFGCVLLFAATSSVFVSLAFLVVFQLSSLTASEIRMANELEQMGARCRLLGPTVTYIDVGPEVLPQSLDAIVSKVAELKSPRELSLFGQAVSCNTITALASIKKLKLVVFTDCQVSENALEALEKASPQLRVVTVKRNTEAE